MVWKKKKPIILHTCGECANITPVTAPHHLLNVRGEPILGTFPYWRESRCTLLSWKSQCIHFKPKRQ